MPCGQKKYKRTSNFECRISNIEVFYFIIRNSSESTLTCSILCCSKNFLLIMHSFPRSRVGMHNESESSQGNHRSMPSFPRLEHGNEGFCMKRIRKTKNGFPAGREPVLDNQDYMIINILVPTQERGNEGL